MNSDVFYLGNIQVTNQSLEWAVLGLTMIFRSKPEQNGSIEIWYLQKYSDLSSDSATLPAYFPQQAEDYIVYAAAADMTIREKVGPLFTAQANSILQDIVNEISTPMNAGNPRVIRDTFKPRGW